MRTDYALLGMYVRYLCIRSLIVLQRPHSDIRLTSKMRLYMISNSFFL